MGEPREKEPTCVQEGTLRGEAGEVGVQSSDGAEKIVSGKKYRADL